MARFRASWLVACGIAACSSTPPPENCGKLHAAFHVVISASGGPLPADTLLHVTYGGGTEDYALATPPTQPGVVYCSVQLEDGGTADAGTPSVAALVCDLWTQAAATVEVSATGYPTLSDDLEPKRNDCGIQTVESVLVLDKGDAS